MKMQHMKMWYMKIQYIKMQYIKSTNIMRIWYVDTDNGMEPINKHNASTQIQWSVLRLALDMSTKYANIWMMNGYNKPWMQYTCENLNIYNKYKGMELNQYMGKSKKI